MMLITQTDIENIIKLKINKHLVLHTPCLPDRRCRIDILVEEAAKEILERLLKKQK
jgi:hypothetical protein